MVLEDRPVAGDDRDTVLSAAALLYANGQSTSMMLTAVDRLNRGLQCRVRVVPAWASLLAVEEGTANPARVAPVSPTSVNMRRVATAMRAIDRAEDGPLDRDEIRRALKHAAAEPFSGHALFILACATGAGALAVVFGATDVRTVLLAALSAAVGGALRRALGRAGLGPLAQVFAAAAVAGLIGAMAVRLGLGTAALASLCPAMVLVPGPPILNGALDLLALRITLGFARWGFAALVLAAITAGLIAGLGLGGQTLPATGVGAAVPLSTDVLAAGVAAASYPVYFSMPYRMIGWPVAAGMAAHAVHWLAMSVWHASLAAAAFCACLVVGAILTPVAYRLRMPFAAIGFAAVVALVPGLYVFRMLGGLVALPSNASPDLLTATVSDGATTALVVAGMAVGLAIPIAVRDAVLARREGRR
jgi:uncharacterized membrane protein YjjP (DUF1212 family)